VEEAVEGSSVKMLFVQREAVNKQVVRATCVILEEVVLKAKEA